MRYNKKIMEEANNQVGVASEPAAYYAVRGSHDNGLLDEDEYDCLGKDFGYARTLEELEVALDEADAERNDSTKWITAAEFHSRLENKYPWLQ